MINQPFVPSTATISNGTNVIWLNADVGHEHSIVLTDAKNPENPIAKKTTFDYGESYEHQFNSVGEFTYIDSETYGNDSVMTGRISVVDLSSQGNATDIDVVGSFIAPTEDLAEYVDIFQDSEIKIHDVHDYISSSLDEKTSLLVWTSSEQDIDDVLDILKEMTKHLLPYDKTITAFL